jgi:DNA repair protein RadC
MTGAAGKVGEVAGAMSAPRAAPRNRSGGSRDRWLLMRLLGAVESVPRLADRLLAERGSLGAVLALSDERLRQLGADANGIAILGLLREAISAVLSPEGPERPRIGDASTVAEWLYASMAWLPVEEVRALFLDGGQRLIRAERLGTGSVRAAVVYPREVARRALELSASAVILVHNHPSGDPTPSAEDVTISRRVAAALATIEVTLLDHVVIARGGWASAMPARAAPGGRPLSMIDMSTARTCAGVADPA